MTTDLFGVDHGAPRTIGSHESNSGGTDEWLTPPSLIAALGSFDLDPCSPGDRPWDTAAKHYGIEEDGLRQEWHGRVWLNPPYAHAAKWLHRLANHGQGTALIFARTETRLWFDHVWPRATGLLFLKGRIRFHYPNGKEAGAAGAPSVLVADLRRLRLLAHVARAKGQPIDAHAAAEIIAAAAERLGEVR